MGIRYDTVEDYPATWDLVPFPDTLSTAKFTVGKIKKSEYQEVGVLPVIDQSQEAVAGYTDEASAVYDGPLPVIVFGDHTRFFKLVGYPFACGADGTKVLIPEASSFDAEFMFYVLSALELPSRGYNRHFKLLKETALPKPPLPEQRAIAHVLRTVQQAREATEQVIAAARELKRSMMQHLFTYGPIGVQEAALLDMQESEIGDIPASWSVTPLGEWIEKPQYGYTESASELPVGPRFLRITDIQDDKVDWPTVPYCECSESDMSKYQLLPGDVVVARIGATTGKSFFVDEVPGGAVFASYLIRLRAEPGLRPRFLGYLTQTDQYWRQINAEKGGRLKAGVNSKNLSSLLVPIPSEEEQDQITGILSELDFKLAAEEQRRDALDALFSSLLHDLMTARIRVPVEEFAEVTS